MQRSTLKETSKTPMVHICMIDLPFWVETAFFRTALSMAKLSLSLVAMSSLTEMSSTSLFPVSPQPLLFGLQSITETMSAFSCLALLLSDDDLELVISLRIYALLLHLLCGSPLLPGTIIHCLQYPNVTVWVCPSLV